MIRRLVASIYSLVGLALVFVGLTALWIVLDGQRDTGSHADVAVVPGHAGIEDAASWDQIKARLDRAIDLYKANVFTSIIISGAEHANGEGEAGKMIHYLEEQGIPSSAIIGDEEKVDTQQMTSHWLTIMKERQFESVMIITDYYEITRLKFALWREGDVELEQTHIGTFHMADAGLILRDVFGLYSYIYRLYLLPAAQEATKDVKSEATKAKESVDKKIDSLSK